MLCEHHQLRHLVASSDPGHVYYLSLPGHVRRWDLTEDVVDAGAPSALSTVGGHTRHPFRIISLAADGDLVFVGGYEGEVVCRDVRREETVFDSVIGTTYNALINGLTVGAGGGGRALFVACNDRTVRVMPLETMQIEKQFQLPWACNVRRMFFNILSILTPFSTPLPARAASSQSSATARPSASATSASTPLT